MITKMQYQHIRLKKKKKNKLGFDLLQNSNERKPAIKLAAGLSFPSFPGGVKNRLAASYAPKYDQLDPL